MDLKSIFSIDVPLSEIILRGTVMYLGVLFLLRVVLRREVGSIGVPDLLMITLIADASQNGMSSDYKSLSAGLVLVLTIIFWNFALDYCSYRLAWLERILSPPPLRLIYRGRMLQSNMKKELLTKDELLSLLREKGVDKPENVREAYLEGNGQLSVLKYKD